MDELDVQWAAFLDRVFALWRQHADTPTGIFNPYLDRQWRHHVDGPRTLVSQCRLIYNFARAFERNRDPSYSALAHRGIEALIRSFRSANDDGWIWSCTEQGDVVDDTFNAYGHAFVVLALATSATVFDDGTYRDLALNTWHGMQSRFQDQHGGLRWHIDRDSQRFDELNSQNPIMHTFEALLVLSPLDPSGAIEQDVRRIWQFVEARQLAPGSLPEWYDDQWQPASDDPNAIVEVGHLVEWAFLLSEASRTFGDDQFLAPGRTFLRYGLQHGYDQTQGGIFSQFGYDGRVRGTKKGWWEQCEAIRTMQRYVARHDATEIVAPLQQSLSFVRHHFVDEVYGGWYVNPPGMGGEPSLAKGNAYKLDYHVVNMCRELLDR